MIKYNTLLKRGKFQFQRRHIQYTYTHVARNILTSSNSSGRWSRTPPHADADYRVEEHTTGHGETRLQLGVQRREDRKSAAIRVIEGADQQKPRYFVYGPYLL
jgi:hypothetical protein